MLSESLSVNSTDGGRLAKLNEDDSRLQVPHYQHVYVNKTWRRTRAST